MKKLPTYILLCIFFLNIVSCDFIRKLAGRPTSADIEEKAALIQERRQRTEDSIRVAKALAQARLDSVMHIDSVQCAIEDMGYKFSDRFAYGESLESLQHRYYLIIGVYRTARMLQLQVDAQRKRGYNTVSLSLEGGVKVLALYASDDIDELYCFLQQTRAEGACPADAWIYTNSY